MADAGTSLEACGGSPAWARWAKQPAGSCQQWAQGRHVVGSLVLKLRCLRTAETSRKGPQQLSTAGTGVTCPGHQAMLPVKDMLGMATALKPQPRVRLTLGKEQKAFPHLQRYTSLLNL